MRRTLITCLLIALLPLCSSQARPKTRTVRLSCYNTQHGQGMDEHVDFLRQADVLRQQKPDVIALQEVDSMTERTDNRYGLEEMAKALRMKAVYAPAIHFQGGRYGVGILCKKKPLSVTRIPMPGREEARVLLVVEFKHYVIACTHLSLTEADRLASVDILAREAARWSKPFILMGDLNDTPDAPFYASLTRHFRVLSDTTHPTYPADNPTSCIDYIAVDQAHAPAATVLTTHVGTDQASDHRPLHATIQLEK